MIAAISSAASFTWAEWMRRVVLDYDFGSRVDDSKKLTALQREAAFAEILTKCVVSTSIVECGRIDEINILRAALEAMSRSMADLRLKPDLVLVDGNIPPESAYPVETVIEGDGLSFAVACASIAAKVTRDRIMLSYHERYPEYGFDRHKGYGTPEHLAALKRLGPCPIHRRSFSPVFEAFQGAL